MAADKSFMTRLYSSIGIVAVSLAGFIPGGYVTFGLLLIITLIGSMELYRVMGFHKKPLAFVGYAAAIAWYVMLLFDMQDRLLILTGSLLVLTLAFYVLTFPKYNSEQIMTVIFGFFYVAVTLSYLYRLRTVPCGGWFVLLVFIGSWGSDTCAYLVGRKWGKHKVAPVLSPKKTIEGCVGGVVGAAILAVIFALIVQDDLKTEFSNPMLAFGLTAAASAVVSQIGDMAASGIKRDKGIKDYGKLMPGHGGILDRFDSVIFIAPIVYFLLQVVLK